MKQIRAKVVEVFKMKIVPLILIAISVLSCGNLSFRWNLDKVVNDARRIRDGQKLFSTAHGRYATLSELTAEGVLGKEVADGRDAGYILELEAGEKYYVLSIYPDHSGGVVSPEDEQQLSMFCNETGIIRASVDPHQRADVHSEVMPNQ